MEGFDLFCEVEQSGVAGGLGVDAEDGERFQRVFALMWRPGVGEGNSQGESLFMERLRAPLVR